MTEPVYGVFLLPDAATSAAVSSITFSVERQFGLVSAGRFPPHATLAGSLPIAAGPEVITSALDRVLVDRPAFPVHNSGIVRHGRAVTYDVDRLADGTTNAPLRRLASDVNRVLAPLAHEIDATLVSLFDESRFRAHLSLASHELSTHPELTADVEEFVRAVPAPSPSPQFTARRVALYSFTSGGWDGPWWRSLEWEHIRTWALVEQTV